ncbi:MAG: hypothetical protein AAGU76_01690 [Sedimentibacter sp.]|uniref:Kae1-like domain-containing protein n=1 Tax=Sedimentibacter sp. TaxID=1960295 RepID=UPI0031582891
MTEYVLGIDTSAYTTSIALVDAEEIKVVADLRKVLSVPPGQKGLRQQDAVFQHLKNFHELYGKIEADLKNITTVAVSSRPRNVDGSYMPVFTVGQNFGKIIAKTLSCSYIEYSHQENHIAASLINGYKNINDRILAVHMSGGTTEFLMVKKSPKGYSAEIVGGSKDITFGQLIDRIGTLMEFPFPCGLHMEKFIENKDVNKVKTPPIQKDAFINLSGMENFFANLYENKRCSKEDIIYSLFGYVADCMTIIIEELKQEHDFNTIIIAGGVASNSMIRTTLLSRLKENFEIILPSRENSSDNAVGTAFLPIIDRWYHEVKTD